jgi:hypothetical protein
MKVRLRISCCSLKQRIAQETMCVEYQPRNVGGVCDNDPLSSRRVKLPQEGVPRHGLELGQYCAAVHDRKHDDAARIDRLSLVEHLYVVEVEKIERARRLQGPKVAAFRLDMLC